MALTPKKAVADFEAYLSKFRFCLSPDASALITDIESLAREVNLDLYHRVVLCALLEHFGPLRNVLVRHGFRPQAAILALRRELEDDRSGNIYEPYDVGSKPYSSNDDWRLDVRSRLVDFILAASQRNGTNTVTAHDVVAGFLDEFDDSHPILDNNSWTDKKLRVPYNTLSHVVGGYVPSLWIKFDLLRDELGLLSLTRQAPIEAAPSYLKPAVMSFLADHPNYRTNCFLMMPFRQTEFHQKVVSTLRAVMQQWGFTVLRADDKHYTEDVFTNIETYMHGCQFGLAVHERVLSNDHNVNVAFEMGYMLGQRKHVCLLKEKTVERLPTDLQGRLYVEFDGFSIESTLENALSKWLTDRGLLQTRVKSH